MKYIFLVLIAAGIAFGNDNDYSDHIDVTWKIDSINTDDYED